MEKLFGNADNGIRHYVQNLLKAEDAVLAAARKECLLSGMPDIQVSEFDGRHLEVLVRMANAKKAVEIGTLGGYSGIFLIRGMGPNGHLYTFELSPAHAQVAHRNFKAAGLEGQVTQYVGPALENLKSIESEGPFDLVFIDADKASYPQYLDWAEKNLRTGGVVIGDNSFAFGRIGACLPGQEESSSVLAMREFNARLASSVQFCTTIFPTGEGLTVGVKIS